MKTTISKYGWLVVTVIIIAILIGLALPAANYMKDKGAGVVGGLGDKLQSGQDYTMPYTVSLKTNIAEAGTVTFTGEYSGTKINLQGSQTISVRATANGGYAFVGWYVGDTLLSADAECSFTVNAATKIEARFEVNCVDFTVTSSNRDKVGYTGEEGENLVIPEKFEDTDGTWYKVVSIDGTAFYKCTNLTSVTIPDSVISIEDGPNALRGAFYGCTNLESVTFGEDSQLSVIGVATFRDCTKLTNITIPNSVTSIAEYTFENCTNLTSITIPDSATSIGSRAFFGCQNLASITIPEVTSIGSYAFQGCTNLKTVYYEGSLEQWCNISFDSNYTNPCRYGAALYIGGELADDIVILDTITEIKEYTFEGCTSITSVTIPDSVTIIGDRAFSNCTNLAIVTFGENSQLTTIDDYAFYGCSSLISIAIPDSVTSIGEYAFEDCTSLTSVNIPDGVTSISNRTFGNCKSLASVTIPDSVTSIGEEAFGNCTSLTNITIPDSVTSIGGYAFQKCTSLTNITIPDGVTSIGNYAFNNCTNLTSITILATEPPTLGSNIFYKCSKLTAITVPAGCGDAYKAASGWSTYASIIVEAQ